MSGHLLVIANHYRPDYFLAQAFYLRNQRESAPTLLHIVIISGFSIIHDHLVEYRLFSHIFVKCSGASRDILPFHTTRTNLSYFSSNGADFEACIFHLCPHPPFCPPPFTPKKCRCWCCH